MENITQLLLAWNSGDLSARNKVSALVYDRLKDIAEQRFARERAGLTLQPTALLHEAFVRLWKSDVTPSNSRHFYALAAVHMRSILVDHARRKLADKRGGQQERCLLENVPLGDDMASVEFLDLDNALVALEREDAAIAKMLELSYFGGLEQTDIAKVMQISLSTVERGLRFGRAWLKRALT
jgi:RNA polymerase sigma factor (TIGR02999 family)